MMASGSLGAVSAVRAAGNTDPGLLRDVNEDRFHLDLARGLFMVVDGVGGQAAGGKAADTAVSLLRARLERETGPVPDRLREAITVANNEIHRLAGLRPEWSGMACVLTVAVVEEGRATIAHVGDTRLYKLRGDRLEKVTRDHSPVGEREDAGEISELEAMNHPRRNEVYRDVGSEPHKARDPEFIDVHAISFESDAALLLCSDGLTDVVDSSSIQRVVTQWAGHPQQVVDALIEAANAAGGKDNVTVVYVEGELFAATGAGLPGSDQEITRRHGTAAREAAARQARSENVRAPGGAGRESVVRALLVVLLTLVILLVVFQAPPDLPLGSTAAPPAGAADALARHRDAITVDRGRAAECPPRHDDRGCARPVPRDADAQEPCPAGERSPARRGPPAAGVRTGSRCRDCRQRRAGGRGRRIPHRRRRGHAPRDRGPDERLHGVAVSAVDHRRDPRGDRRRPPVAGRGHRERHPGKRRRGGGDSQRRGGDAVAQPVLEERCGRREQAVRGRRWKHRTVCRQCVPGNRRPMPSSPRTTRTRARR